MQAPLSVNDARSRYCRSFTLHIPEDSDLGRFLAEEQCPDTETPEDALIRPLRERMRLSREGF
jgi:hypothetical protein